ncbi:hypothetical protein FKG94_17960 [Exilibacterium tricleocarpae]|uniref:DUF1834 family protein n=1 Tax=Exilibacterium tricleocarpae TaxID=2591008 RepID=A0A545T5R9_9GAMM|nr:hypothetical protein [Exilibacterium tricleocarpae]TQV72586.1 hypothetical protein FKG94_17960 [Exilibacterium tricleocarpae]
MNYISEYIESVAAGIEQMGAELAPPLQSRPLAGLVETTLDTAALRSDKKSAVYVTAVGSGETLLVETGANDVTLRMVAYLMVVEPDSEQRTTVTQNLLVRLMGHISGQRWGLPYAYPAATVEAADLHGLTKGFKPDTSSWRLSVSVLAHAADLYGDDQGGSQLSLWAITWEQKLRIDGCAGPDAKPTLPPRGLPYSRFPGEVAQRVDTCSVEKSE